MCVDVHFPGYAWTGGPDRIDGMLGAIDAFERVGIDSVIVMPTGDDPTVAVARLAPSSSRRRDDAGHAG